MGEKELKEQLEEFTSEKEMLAQNVSELTTEMVKLKETLIDEEKLFNGKMEEVEKELLLKQEKIDSLQNKNDELIGGLSKTQHSEDDFIQVNEALKETKLISKKFLEEKNEA